MRVKEPNIETDQIYLRFLVEFLILKIKMESGEINKITHGKSDTGGGGITVPSGKALVTMIKNFI